ncbi:MAG: RNA polymerase sigma factor [Candidatus Dormibacteraceae bacterium]
MSFDLAGEGRVSGSRSLQEEAQLVARAKDEPSAFGELYELHFQRMYRFVYSRVQDRAVAEDVTSEVFMKALRGIGRYQDTGRPFTAWLYQIAVNAVADRYRAQRPTDDIDAQYDLSDGTSLEETAAHRDEVRRIWALIEGLPDRQRTALILKFQEDMKIEDIAVAMGKSPGAVKLLVHRGVTRLRQQAGGQDLGRDVGEKGA